MKCPTCNQEIKKDNESEYVSMIDFAVGYVVREVVAKVVSDKVGIDVMEGRQILIDLMKEENEAPENIRIWFEKNIR